jgi:hypothetical protein
MPFHPSLLVGEGGGEGWFHRTIWVSTEPILKRNGLLVFALPLTPHGKKREGGVHFGGMGGSCKGASRFVS